MACDKLVYDLRHQARKLHYQFDGIDAPLFFLRVPSVELYFAKYSGNLEAFLNGLNVHKGVVYLFASGSTLRLPMGQPIYYSDISSHYSG